MNGDAVIHEVRNEQSFALGVVADVGGRVHILDHRLESSGAIAAVHRFPVPTGDQERAVLEDQQSVQTSVWELYDICFFPVGDAIELVRTKGDDLHG